MKILWDRSWPVVLGVVLLLVLFSADANAAVDNHDILDGIIKELKDVTARMSGKLVDFATSLFWSLAVINMVWTFGMMVMRKADIGEFFAELSRYIITLGFFWWLLTNAVTGMNIAGTIIESMRDMAAQASGLGSGLSPSGVVDVGFDVLSKVMKADMGLAETIVACAVAIIVLLIFAAVGVNMVLVLAESYFLLYCGLFILGFGGSRWTSDMAIGYYRQVLGVGFKLFGMALIVGVGAAFIDIYVARLTANVRLTELAVMLVAAYVFYKLSDHIPSMMASLISGGGGPGSFTSGGGAVSAGAIAGAAAGLAAAAASGGASLAASAAGGAQALMAAASAASQDGGGGSMSSAGGSSGESSDVGVASGEPMAAASGGGGSPMAHAAGDGASGGGSAGGGGGGGGSSSGAKTAGQIANGTVANLAKGIGSMASAKASSMADAAKSRIAETAGGKLAATIKAASSSSASSQAASFDGNSLSATNGSTEAGGNDEVAAFVNRPQTT